MVGLYPIVIFFKPDSKNHVKTVRASFKTSKGGQKLNKELYALATEIEKHYSHIISGKIKKRHINKIFRIKSWFQNLVQIFFENFASAHKSIKD